MEINVGDYVRTENGIIGKLVDEYTFKNRRVCYPEPQEWVLEINNNEVSIMESIDNIIKSSKDITELLEVGDILIIDEDPELSIDIEKPIVIENTLELEEIKKQIKGKIIVLKKVLTKEQFSQMEYR